MAGTELKVAGENPAPHSGDLLVRLRDACLDLLVLGASACDVPVALVGVPARAGRWATVAHGPGTYEGLPADRLLQAAMAAGGPCDLSGVLTRSSGRPGGPDRSIRWAYGGPLLDAEGRPVGGALLLDTRDRNFTAREREAVGAMTRRMSAELSSARTLAQMCGPHVVGLAPLRPHPLEGPAAPDHGGLDLLRSSDVAALFHVSCRTVANWASSGRLRSVRTVGGQWRFPADDVAALLASARHGRPVREKA